MKALFSKNWFFFPLRVFKWLYTDTEIEIEAKNGLFLISGPLRAIAFISMLLGIIGLLATVGFD